MPHEGPDPGFPLDPEDPFPVHHIPAVAGSNLKEVTYVPVHRAIGRAIFGPGKSVADIIGGAIGGIIGRPRDGETETVPGPGNGTGVTKELLVPGKGRGGMIDIGRPDTVFVRSLPERGEGLFDIDVGEIDIPPERHQLTASQIRAFLLREAGRAIGKSRIDYGTFKRLVRDLGVEMTRERLNLDETSMMFLLATPPKRRGRGITAAQLRNVRRTLGKLKTVNSYIKDACSGVAPVRRSRARKAPSTSIVQAR